MGRVLSHDILQWPRLLAYFKVNCFVALETTLFWLCLLYFQKMVKHMNVSQSASSGLSVQRNTVYSGLPERPKIVRLERQLYHNFFSLGVAFICKNINFNTDGYKGLKGKYLHCHGICLQWSTRKLWQIFSNECHWSRDGKIDIGFFDFYMGHLSLWHKYKDWSTLFCIWKMKGFRASQDLMSFHFTIQTKKCTLILIFMLKRQKTIKVEKLIYSVREKNNNIVLQAYATSLALGWVSFKKLFLTSKFTLLSLDVWLFIS